MKIFDGLYFYELILLILGTLLFVTLLVILVVFVIQKRHLKELLAFFIMPIIMIGYPSIQKIKYDNGVFTFEKAERDFAKDPQNLEARNILNQNLSSISKRPNSNPELLLSFGKAQAVLGDTVQAKELVDRALNISPELSEARNLQKKFDTPQVRIENMISEIEARPDDNAKKAELKEMITNYNITSSANSSALMTAAKSHAILADTAKARTFVNEALKKDANNAEALKLKRNILRTSVVK